MPSSHTPQYAIPTADLASLALTTCSWLDSLWTSVSPSVHNEVTPSSKAWEVQPSQPGHFYAGPLLQHSSKPSGSPLCIGRHAEWPRLTMEANTDHPWGPAKLLTHSKTGPHGWCTSGVKGAGVEPRKIEGIAQRQAG